MRNIVSILIAITVLGVSPVYALDYLSDHIPKAQKVGEGRFTKYIWDVYDATLYAPQGKWERGKPFALKLSYLRKLHGQKIADRSIEEMRGQGFSDEIKLATWHTQMRNIFPDVDDGVSLTGVYTATGETIFYKDHNEIGRVSDTEFSNAFFGIWLNENTRAPTLRQKLLGDL